MHGTAAATATRADLTLHGARRVYVRRVYGLGLGLGLGDNTAPVGWLPRGPGRTRYISFSLHVAYSRVPVPNCPVRGGVRTIGCLHESSVVSPSIPNPPTHLTMCPNYQKKKKTYHVSCTRALLSTTGIESIGDWSPAASSHAVHLTLHPSLSFTPWLCHSLATRVQFSPLVISIFSDRLLPTRLLVLDVETGHTHTFY